MYIMKQIIIAFLFLFTFSQTYTQIDTVWTRNLGGSGDEPYGDWPVSQVVSALTPDGNLIIASTTNSSDGMVGSSLGGSDGWIVKLDDSGNTLWSKVFGGSKNDFMTGLSVSPNGRFYICGYTYSNSHNLPNHPGSEQESAGFVARFDSDGSLIWSKQYGGSEMFGIQGNDYLYSITELHDGTVLLVGKTNSLNGDLYFDPNMFMVGWVLQIDSMGNVLNSKKFAAPNHDEWNANELLHVFQMPDSSAYMVLGQTYEFIANDKLWMMYFDMQHNLLWQQVYGSASETFAGALHVNKHNEIFVAGFVKSGGGDVSGSFLGGFFDIWLLQLDNANGNIVNQKLLGSADGSEWPFFLTSDCNNRLLIGGHTTGTDVQASQPGYGLADFWLLSVDENLDTLWTFRAGGSDVDVLTNVHFYDNCQDIFLTGKTASNDFFVSTNYGGNDIWVARSQYPYLSTYNMMDQIDVKIFPNPSSEYVIVRFPEHNHISGTLQIFDVTGKLVFVKDVLNNSPINIDVQHFQNGMYLLRFVYDNKSIKKSFFKY
jgi:hypothetical protein